MKRLICLVLLVFMLIPSMSFAKDRFNYLQSGEYYEQKMWDDSASRTFERQTQYAIFSSAQSELHQSIVLERMLEVMKDMKNEMIKLNIRIKDLELEVSEVRKNKQNKE